jgi:membrane protease subunit HflK
LLRQYKNKLFASFRGKSSSSKGRGPFPDNASIFFVAFVLVAVLIIWALSGIFIVSPGERAVILRFGKYAQTVEPGPHWIPRFIESKYVVNVQQVSNFSYQSEMLTKDENIVSVTVAVQYRVKDARSFLINVVNPRSSLEQATASALRQAVGHNTLDDLLTTGRQQVREQVAGQLQQILTSYNIGLLVTDVTLQSIRPPEAVTAAFDDAIKAREDQQSYINRADAYSKQVVAAAQGQAARILQEAEAFKTQVVLGAKAETAGYLALLPEYQKAPEVMRERLYLSALESILTKTSKVFINQKSGNPLFYLPLDKIISGTPTSVALAEHSANAGLPSAMTEVKSSDIVNALAGRSSYPVRGNE